MSRRTNDTNSDLWSISSRISLHHREDKIGEDPAYPIFFIFFGAALGALLRVMLMNCPIKCIRGFPYTVLVTLFGAAFSALQYVPGLQGIEPYLSVASLNAHLILAVFLPVLIFSSAFEIEMHIFYKSLVQILTLAGPGTLISTTLTATVIKLIWDWTWLGSLLVGSIISANDPVAVVSILQESGAPARLGVLVDGEALMNDGACIVLFTIFLDYQQYAGFPGFIFFVKVIFLSPFIGFLMGLLGSRIIALCYNDVITETIITICFPYIAFIIAEELIGVSGVLVILVIGLTLAHFKTSISPQVQPVLVHIWHYLTFLANTLIFFLMGVVISTQLSGVSDPATRFGEVIAVYILIMAIRMLCIVILYPILKRTGYGINWRIALVMVWGGLRGAVGLSLALVVFEQDQHDAYWHEKNHGQPQGLRSGSILIWTIGIVLLTLIANATTVSGLLKVLDFGKASIAKKINMTAALAKVEDSLDQTKSVLKSDQFLVGANWEYVEHLVILENVYQDEEDDDTDIFLLRKTTCPECSVKVQNNPSAKEVEVMLEESRNRLLRLEGVSYLTLYEEGRLSQQATHHLHSRTEELAEKEEGYTNLEEVIEEHKTSNMLYAKRGFRRRAKKDNQDTENVTEHKNKQTNSQTGSFSTVPDDKRLPNNSTKYAPTRKERIRYIVDSWGFELPFVIIIIANTAFIIYDGSRASRCNLIWLQIVDGIFLILYFIELVMRTVGHGKDYIPRSFWGWLDYVCVFLGFVSFISVQVLHLWEGTAKCTKAKDEPDEGNEAKALTFVKIIKFVRFIRILRLLRVCMPAKVVEKMVDRSYHAVIEIACSMVTAQDNIQHHIHQVPISVHNPIRDVIEARVQANRFIGNKILAKLTSERPGVEVSIRTQQAAAAVIEVAIKRLEELSQMGLIGDKEKEALEDMLEKKKVSLKKIPPSIPEAEFHTALNIVSWIDRDSAVKKFIVEKAELLHFSPGHKLNERRLYKGIFIIARGSVLIKGVTGLSRAQAETWDEASFTARDIDALWEDNLPDNFLQQLHRPKGMMNNIKNPSVLKKQMREKLLQMEFIFTSRGAVINQANIVYPSVSVCPVFCESLVTAYYLSASDVMEMITQFSYRFESLEAKIWKTLASNYLLEDRNNVQNQDNLSHALVHGFVIFVDGNHRSSRTMKDDNNNNMLFESEPSLPYKMSNKVTFEMDYVNFQHVVLLKGTAKSSLIEQFIQGPCKVHRGEQSLEMAVPAGARPEDVVAAFFVVPNPGNDVNQKQAPDLEAIRDNAAGWLRNGWGGNDDKLLLRSLDELDNSPNGASPDSTLFISIRNRIQQVILAVASVVGETISAQEVILGEGILSEADEPEVEDSG